MSEHFVEKIVNKRFCLFFRPDAVSLNDGSVLVVLDHPSTVPLKGKARVSCLVGTVDIMGYKLSADQAPCDVFSPDCYSLVSIATDIAVEDQAVAMKNVHSNLTQKIGKLASQLQNILKTKDSFVILRFCRLETNLHTFIHSFQKYSGILKCVGDKWSVNKKLLPLDVILPTDSPVPQIELPPEIHDVLEMWRNEFKIKGKFRDTWNIMNRGLNTKLS